MAFGKARSWLHLILMTILALVLRKVYLGHEAMTVVRQCRSQVGVEALVSQRMWHHILGRLR